VVNPSSSDAAATVTKIIHNARWMAGLTQAEVAQRAGISQQSVALYEGGKRQPSVATLTRLVAGCGLHLDWKLVPVAGLEDEPTRELLAVAPLARLEPALVASLSALAITAREIDLLVGGKTAARLHGAAIRVYEIELWVDERVDLEVLEAYLRQAGVEYVSPAGISAPPVPERLKLLEGWPLVAPGWDLMLRCVPNFPTLVDYAVDVTLPGGHNLLVASTDDCSRGWRPRDLDRLALARAVRLAGELRG
jgi:transcriptional regulator with XRE-family HTH domain